jgi:hypothetical protein
MRRLKEIKDGERRRRLKEIKGEERDAVDSAV